MSYVVYRRPYYYLVVDALLGDEEELGARVREDVLALLQPLLLVHGHVHRPCRQGKQAGWWGSIDCGGRSVSLSCHSHLPFQII